MTGTNVLKTWHIKTDKKSSIKIKRIVLESFHCFDGPIDTRVNPVVLVVVEFQTCLVMQCPMKIHKKKETSLCSFRLVQYYLMQLQTCPSDSKKPTNKNKLPFQL